jgi:hypothetical protein
MLKKMANIAGVAACIVTIICFISSGVIWAADQRWVTHSRLAQQFQTYRLSSINDTIGELEMKIKYGEGTKADELRLNYYKDRREEVMAALSSQ